MTSLRQQTADFYRRYLHSDPRNREHISILFYDRALPSWFLAGLSDVAQTRWLTVDARSIESQQDVLRRWWDPRRRYISVHDYVVDTFFGAEQAAVRFAEVSQGIDYTSFEFPRFDVSDAQIEFLLTRFVQGDPLAQLRRADAFYSALDNDPGYQIVVQTGPQSHTLTITGPHPWMELTGPLCEGNMRFAPGSELFYHHHDAAGELWCGAGVNLLPLRAAEPDRETCQRILTLGAALPSDPLVLTLDAGRVVSVVSERGQSAEMFQQLIDAQGAFSHVVEIGVGLSMAARPLVKEWAATSNEAIPGVHIGVGADPSNTARFSTNVHMDFVCPDATITINGTPFYGNGRFSCDRASTP